MYMECFCAILEEVHNKIDYNLIDILLNLFKFLLIIRNINIYTYTYV